MSASRLGEPDAGLISYAEMQDSARGICAATRLPVIGDGDTGYGNPLNVMRTVRGYAAAGLAGILIEDQVAPKKCGHTRVKQVVSRGEALGRVRAAVEARDGPGGSGIVVVARSDACQADSLSEALWRAAAFADLGADVVFVDGLPTADAMRALCRAVPGCHKMANSLEGGGKSPLLPPRELEEMGFKIVAYPLSLLGVSIRAMELALEGLQSGKVPGPEALPSFGYVQEVVGFPLYYATEGRFAAAQKRDEEEVVEEARKAGEAREKAEKAKEEAEASSRASEPASGSSSNGPRLDSSSAVPVVTATVDDRDGPQPGGGIPPRPRSPIRLQLRLRVSDRASGETLFDHVAPMAASPGRGAEGGGSDADAGAAVELIWALASGMLPDASTAAARAAAQSAAKDAADLGEGGWTAGSPGTGGSEDHDRAGSAGTARAPSARARVLLDVGVGDKARLELLLEEVGDEL